MAFIFSFSLAIAKRVPMTLAPPHISYFISSIAADGLILIPPESKVRPLPTKQIGFCLLGHLYIPK